MHPIFWKFFSFLVTTAQESFLPGTTTSLGFFMVDRLRDIWMDVAKRFLPKFHEFTNDQYEEAIKWMTKKVKSLFSLRDINPYLSCVIYEENCNCG